MRRPRAVIEDLEALALGDQAPDAPQPADDAPSSPSTPAARTSAPTSPAVVVVSTLAPVISPSVGDRERSADISGEEGQPEKRPRIEASPNSLAALGLACALPWDIEKWGRLDNATLLLSTMGSAISVSL
eukprot:TRINITY_DN23177_c1_g1_i1.p1 TRINITY_DN23177_c1_g1~~TRINITY_DN23177_c1_g1_i1.p1  ORF type:complete len:130 (-),score=22.39 TRINITY_DN23177_c1_g1_i1:482-871(-)